MAMAMATSSAFFPTFRPSTPTDPPKQLTTSHSILFNPQSHQHKRPFSFSALASSLPLPMNVDYLEREFSSDGVSFEGIGDGCVVKMRLDNGSMACLMLPSGLITSYKPQMWHGTTMEVLHTMVFEGENGEAVVQGGVSVNFECTREGDLLLPWSPRNWALGNITGSSEKAIQVELISINPEDKVEVTCLVTLREDLLGSELTVTNPKPSPLQMLGSIITHLKVSTPEATSILGLQGSNYHGKHPVVSEFSIVPADRPVTSSQLWVPKALQDLFLKGDQPQGEGEDAEGEEEDNCYQMTEKMSRIYTSAPREFTIIDRGRRNSVVVRRSGFDELYVFSPGSKHDEYGRYAFICIGPSAALTPIVLGPGDVWRGAQYLYNPSL